ncbi:MAG TPA: hypothetical protein VLE95_06695 [Chlamydiales bacterium]|nr:hypothetical protein [Chlamydiales bacterium]
MGYGLISDRIHAPNEHFDMHRLEQGFLTIARALWVYTQSDTSFFVKFSVAEQFLAPALS